MNSDDIDPRYSLANERTFLSWIRTSLGLLAGAAGLLAVNLPWPAAVAQGLACLLAVVAGLSAFAGWERWRKVEEAIRTNRPAPSPAAHVLLLAIAVVAAAAIIVVLAIS